MKFPNVISRFFEPIFVVLPFILCLVILQSGMTTVSLIRLGMALVAFVFFPILIVMVMLVKTKKITNWDVSDRRQRIKVLGGSLALFVIAFVIIQQFNNTFVTSFLLLYLLWFSGFFLQTFLYKISGHVGMLTLAVGLVIYWFGWGWWPLIVFIPLVSWARIVLKRHTVVEVIAAVLYSSLLLLASIYFAIL